MNQKLTVADTEGLTRKPKRRALPDHPAQTLKQIVLQHHVIHADEPPVMMIMPVS